MILVLIGILFGIALALIRSIIVTRPESSSDEVGLLPAWHSDYKQLRVEYHQSVDKSVSPPK
jgi:hypothetical protein